MSAACARRPAVDGILTARAGRSRPRPSIAAHAGAVRRRSRGPSASTPTSGTTSRPRWRCSSAARSRPPSAAYDWVPRDAARRRLVADEDRRRRGRGPPRRDQHVGLPRRRRLAPLAGRAATSTFVRRMWPAVRRGLDFVVVACSCRSAASPGRRSGTTAARRRSTRTRCSPARRASTSRCAPGVALAELLDDPQPEWELAGGRLGHALREHRDLFLDKSTFSMDWYYPVLGGAVRGEAGARAARRALGRLRRARARHPLRRHQPVGDRRRDLRAGDGARRPRRPRPRAAAARRHAAPARRRRVATGPATSSPDDVNWPVEHTTYTAAAVILAVDALSRRHARGADIMRGTTLAPHFARARRSSAAAASAERRRRPRRDVRRSTRIEPSASTSVKSPLVERAQVDVVRRPPAVGRVREHVVDDQQAAGHHPGRPAGVVVLGVLLAVAAVDEQQRQRECASARRPSCDGRRPRRPGPRARRAAMVRRKTGSVSISPSSASTRVASWCSQPAWFSSEPRWWSTVKTVPPTSRAAAPR